MKQQVNDISAVLRGLSAQIESMQKTIDSQHATLCQINRTSQGQLKEIRDLKKILKKKDKELDELRQRLSKYEEPPKNSGNSSTPPSKERISDEIIRRTKSLRKPTGKKPGGQPGHDGSTLGLHETVDHIKNEKPDTCDECGESLAGCDTELDYITQIISLPELKPLITEVRHYVTICRTCGKRVKAQSQRRRSNAVVYDASVKGLVVYLSTVQFLPYNRIASFFKEVFGLEISQGSMVNWINEAKRAAAPAIDKIKEYIMQSAVVGFDESGCYCNKHLDWAWIAQTVYFTLVFHGKSRKGQELEDRFGDSLERMTAVTDRHSAYFALHFLNHQVCLAHLLRECQYLNELDKEQQWSKSVETLLQEAIHERNQRPTESIDPQSWLKRLDRLVDENLSKLNDKFTTFRNGLLKCRDYIFSFLRDPAIPPDNNASERGIRKLKIKLKNSGCFRSDLGADAFMDLHSIVETTKKHGNSPYNSILALF
ncbi:MAG: IS66 family transposase [Muribaculaceae bacterium]|nr:IS66 family transposase [Muribaculaceae bacterium]MDE6794903.1 IS66 family transposase [Muribaculaceae bacterium]